MNKAFWLFIIYIFLSPFYVFDSGNPQPADFLLAITCFFGILISDKKVFLQKPVIAFLRLLLLILVVSFINEYHVSLLGLTGGAVFAAIFYVYNFVVFVLIFVLWKKIPREKLCNALSLIIVMTLFTQLALYLLGLGNPNGRAIIFFNNPNQLGYYTLCMISIFTVIPSKYRNKKIIVFAALMISGYLILISGSRAALFGVLLLGIIIIIKEGFKFKLPSILAICFFVIVGGIFISNNDSVQELLLGLSERNEQKESTLENEIKVRGYDRILLYPEYLIYGAGEGGRERFPRAYSKLELHSGFGTILFSYGILGSLFFFLFVYRIVSPNVRSNLFLLLPVFSYNLTHQGLRNTLLWILLAFVYLVSLDEKKKNS